VAERARYLADRRHRRVRRRTHCRPDAYSRNAAEAVGRELEIETRFAADIDKTDLSDWVYNAGPDTPGDLGYWVGYRIAKAYYQNAPDKRQALREIFEMSDPKAFLEKSGWYPGIELDRGSSE
ncbi:MAG TPA: hypothetical protein VIR45_00805, partial [Kiloniellaceae bacterium]